MPHLVWGRSQCPRFLRTLRGLSRRRAPAIRVRQRTSSRCRRGVRAARDPDGLRAAFSWFLKHGKGAEALQLAADLWLFQEQRGHADEARDWLAKSLAAPGAEARTVTRARALYGAGILAFRKLDADAAR